MTADWRDRAECLGADPDLFHPTKDTSSENPRARAAAYAPAVAICQTCPVIDECLADALAEEDTWSTHYRHGVRGGLTPEERGRIARRVARTGRNPR